MNDTTSPRDPSLAGPGRPHPILDALAMWLERSLDETIGWQHNSRLYGLTIVDREALLAHLGQSVGHGAGAARITYLAHGWVYDLLASPSAQVATEYDALALCCFGRATNLETAQRYRCRTVLVADGSGQSTVNRMRGKGPELTGHPTGPVADLVQELYRQRGAQRAAQGRRQP